MQNLTGQSIGRYHILEQWGEGGMATVYKAYDTRLERNVALKVLRTEMFSPVLLEQVLQRFEREAKSLAKLSHPNIVNILDYGEHEDMPYFVMEFLPGGTLKDKLGQVIPWQEAIHMILPVASGLSYAHQRGIIHRDVKPSNVLLRESMSPVLTDFGIAKLLEGVEGQTLTGSGVGIGTPEYMAPEQGVGAHAIDSRADIYSLGIVLYEMVTGRKPYTADTPMAVVIKQMTDPLPRPKDFVPELPENVEQILLKALAKQPEDRYQSMDEFIKALEGIARESPTMLEAQPESIPPSPVTLIPDAATKIAPEKPAETIVTPTPTPAKPKPALGKWIVAAVVILGISSIGLWAIFGRPSQPSETTAPPTRTSIPEQGAQQPDFTPTVKPDQPKPPEPKPPALPGEVVIPIENMAPEIPWLPVDPNAIPSTTIIEFNTHKPPFDNPLVRKAFAAAIDRRVLADIARKSGVFSTVQPATTLLNPRTLGRNLYGQVGIPFDPDRAQGFLAEAGYPDGRNFPEVVIVVNANDVNGELFSVIQEMWSNVLNVRVEVQFLEWDAYIEVMVSGQPAMVRRGWRVEQNDPDEIMQLFRAGAEFNYADYSNRGFDRLIDQAREIRNPAERQELYIQAERILCEEDTAIIPLYNHTISGE